MSLGANLFRVARFLLHVTDARCCVALLIFDACHGREMLCCILYPDRCMSSLTRDVVLRVLALCSC